jgi:hypothetical protein
LNDDSGSYEAMWAVVCHGDVGLIRRLDKYVSGWRLSTEIYSSISEEAKLTAIT